MLYFSSSWNHTDDRLAIDVPIVLARLAFISFAIGDNKEMGQNEVPWSAVFPGFIMGMIIWALINRGLYHRGEFVDAED